MKIFLWIVAFLVACYVVAVAAMYFCQRMLMYPAPQTTRVAPADAGFPEAEEATVDTRDGEKAIVWHVPPKQGKSVILFLHGNGDVLAWRVPRFRAITADGTGLVALSFRGYGGSTGSPTEAGLLNDGLAAYAFAASRYPAGRIVPWGYSLGTGVAVALAATHPVGKLILEAPYTSTVDVAAGAFPFLPVRWLMRDRFHSDERIVALKAPLLVMHGENDSVIPVQLGRRLYELAPVRKRFVSFPLGTHINLDTLGAVETVHAFLAEAD